MLISFISGTSELVHAEQHVFSFVSVFFFILPSCYGYLQCNYVGKLQVICQYFYVERRFFQHNISFYPSFFLQKAPKINTEQ